MVAYLSRIFGMGRLELAEDVVQDTLCKALEAWSLHGLPENPSAWLMRVARNRAIDLVRRDQLGQAKNARATCTAMFSCSPAS